MDPHISIEKRVQLLLEKVIDLEEKKKYHLKNCTNFFLSCAKKQLLSRTTLDYMIDRGHYMPEARTAPENTPKNILACIHFYQIKIRLLAEMHKKSTCTL